MTKLGTVVGINVIGSRVVPVVGSTEGVSYTIELHEYDNGVGLKEGFHVPSKDIE